MSQKGQAMALDPETLAQFLDTVARFARLMHFPHARCSGLKKRVAT
jgi:hypothetical protein